MKSLKEIAVDLGIKPFNSVGYETPELKAFYQLNKEALSRGDISKQQIYALYLLEALDAYFSGKSGRKASVKPRSVMADFLSHKICLLAKKKVEEDYYTYFRKRKYQEKPSSAQSAEFERVMGQFSDTIFDGGYEWLWRSSFPVSKKDAEKRKDIRPRSEKVAFRFSANVAYNPDWIPKMDDFIRKYSGKYKTPLDPDTSDRVDSLNVYIYDDLKEPTPEMIRDFLKIVQPYVRKENNEWMVGNSLSKGVVWAVEPQKEDAHLRREQSYIYGLTCQNMEIGRRYHLSVNSLGMRYANREVNALLNDMVLAGNHEAYQRNQKIIDILMSTDLPINANEQIELLSKDMVSVNMRGFKSKSAYPVHAEGVTPLMYAAQRARPDIVGTLLSKGADAIGDGGSNLFHHMAEYVYGDEKDKIEEIVRVVMDFEQKKSGKTDSFKKEIFSAKNAEGYNPLTLAMLSGNKAVAQIYQRLGAVPQALAEIECSKAGRDTFLKMQKLLYPQTNAGKSY